jgi:hypothetical protein
MQEYLDCKLQKASGRGFNEQITKHSLSYATPCICTARESVFSSSSRRGMRSRVARTGCAIVLLIVRCSAVRTVLEPLELHLSLRERKRDVKN